uniref:Flap endonuclease 1 n=1 Tax=Ciona intestinalis TaxID=7719 RepID=F6QI83_CIOIN|nr:flap endonuclease 1 [Ciona intestinalis]|eukprot:XP_009861628.1 flap endonuclease 1 [Ciona intestinalis]
MGILGLSKLICDKAPSAVKENEIKNYFGRKVAIDASMAVYQFLIAIRQDGNQLTNEDGEVTSHIAGLFYRTIRLLGNGIKPVFVFDGKPPQMKSGELAKRAERREQAEKELAKAQESGEAADVEKYSRRLVKVTREHMDDCKKLLRLMGIPVVEAPTEAEAQCASLVKSGKVYATATEDMDALTFHSSRLLRHLTFSEARKMPIQEFVYEKVLEEMEMTHEQFVDLCILLGCDYCEHIRGVGPKRAYDLIKQYRSIDEILKNIDLKKYTVPDGWVYKDARQLFLAPDVAASEDVELKWNDPDEEGIVKFMVEEKGFNEDRVRSGIKKILQNRQKSTQGRLDDFFKVLPSTPKTKKRKSDTKIKSESAKKRAKGGSGFRKR